MSGALSINLRELSTISFPLLSFRISKEGLDIPVTTSRNSSKSLDIMNFSACALAILFVQRFLLFKVLSIFSKPLVYIFLDKSTFNMSTKVFKLADLPSSLFKYHVTGFLLISLTHVSIYFSDCFSFKAASSSKLCLLATFERALYSKCLSKFFSVKYASETTTTILSNKSCFKTERIFSLNEMASVSVLHKNKIKCKYPEFLNIRLSKSFFNLFSLISPLITLISIARTALLEIDALIVDILFTSNNLFKVSPFLNSAISLFTSSADNEFVVNSNNPSGVGFIIPFSSIYSKTESTLSS